MAPWYSALGKTMTSIPSAKIREKDRMWLWCVRQKQAMECTVHLSNDQSQKKCEHATSASQMGLSEAKKKKDRGEPLKPESH